jgi:hypothetical protein
MTKFYLFTIIIFTQLTIFPQQSELSKSVNSLSKFIASDYFANLKKTTNDLNLADTIYAHAIKLKNYNYSEALLSLTFATLPYRLVPLEIPFTHIVINFPLYSDADSIYLLKNKNLPKNLLYDSPQDSFGDKDKLAHFFGSAFLSYNTFIFDFADLIGYFVEVFEEAFVVQSTVDFRDLNVDKMGKIFGILLEKNKNLMPSDILLSRSLFNFRYSP